MRGRGRMESTNVSSRGGLYMITLAEEKRSIGEVKGNPVSE